MSVDVAAIQAALEAATDGPWEATSGAPARPFEWGIRTAREPNYAVTLHWSSREDAELIVLLRNNAEALLDALAAERARVERAKKVMDRWDDACFDETYYYSSTLSQALADPAEGWPCADYTEPHSCLTVGSRRPCPYCVVPPVSDRPVIEETA